MLVTTRAAAPLSRSMFSGAEFDVTDPVDVVDLAAFAVGVDVALGS